MRKDKGDLYRKIVAVLLAGGGCAGAIIGLIGEAQLLSAAGSGPKTTTAIVGFIVFVFGASTWVGIDLWRKKPHAFLWSQVLLVAQIPIMSFPGAVYRFYTGLALYLLYDQTSSRVFGFEAQLGSSLSFRILPSIEGFAFGINLVPVIALYLLGKAEPGKTDHLPSFPSAAKADGSAMGPQA